jgi:hypothetical protein
MNNSSTFFLGKHSKGNPCCITQVLLPKNAGLHQHIEGHFHVCGTETAELLISASYIGAQSLYVSMGVLIAISYKKLKNLMA